MADTEAEHIRLFMEISGLDHNTAKQILIFNEYNLERAINFHLENPSEPLNLPDLMNTPAAVPYENDEGIRAPIPPKRETMLLPDQDNFQFRKQQVVQNVCPLRDFKREGELQEAQLSSVFAQNGSSSSSSSSVASSASTGVVSATVTGSNSNNSPYCPERRRLVDLFRPPTDLSFAGTLHAARECAKLRNRWIIVNLQDHTEFMSQVLNRDIWSNRSLKSLIRKYFVFWQVAIDTSEGERFRVFYNADVLPYVCIIDPRTGEQKLSYKTGFKLTAAEFIDELKAYLRTNSSHPSEDDDDVVEISDDLTVSDVEISPSSNRRRAAGRSSTKETGALSEEDQLLLAIQNSIRESQSDNVLPDNNDVIEEIDSDSDQPSDSKRARTIVSADTFTNYLGSKTDPMTKVVLRLPDGHRDTLEWPSSSRLRALRLYVEHQYPELTKEPYKIICPYPRQDVLEMDMTLSLQEAKMHPAVLLHVHQNE